MSMIIDLIPLLNKTVEEIKINSDFSFTKDKLESLDIIDLVDGRVDGTIYLENETVHYLLQVSGKMIIRDAISSENISYPFTIQVEENLENNQNSIDIIDILWQNIVLEVPLKLTEVEDLSQYQGEGWRLVSEEELNKEQNPFAELKDLWREE